MIKDVEYLGPETKVQLLAEMKAPLQRDIGLRSSETPQHIAPEVALLRGLCCGKSRFIEYLAAGILRPIELERRPWIDVRAGRESHARSKDSTPNHVNRR